MSDMQKYINKRLETPEFKKHWEESRLEYEVARQLIQLRKQVGLTQEELAHKLHTRQSEISRIESGDQNISLEKLRRIAETMGGSVEIRIKSPPSIDQESIKQ